MKSIKITIYYYEITPLLRSEFNLHDRDKYAELFTQIMHIVKNRLKNRYQVYGERISKNVTCMIHRKAT